MHRQVTTNGYTVYDPDQGIAYVQVSRGPDNVTLHGMELMIEFGGATYRTTLREPASNSMKSYFFDMTDMMTNELLPGSVSVAPIFILDGRQVLGKITSMISMPIMTIAKTKDEIIGEIDINTEFVNMSLENQTQDLVDNCYDGLPRDAWGGCPIAQGDILKVENLEGDIIFYFEGTDLETKQYISPKGIKFFGDNCVETNNACATFNGVSNSGERTKYITLLTKKDVLNQTTQYCIGTNKFYVYESSDCQD